jgi:hypothetical protein
MRLVERVENLESDIERLKSDTYGLAPTVAGLLGGGLGQSFHQHATTKGHRALERVDALLSYLGLTFAAPTSTKGQIVPPGKGDAVTQILKRGALLLCLLSIPSLAFAQVSTWTITSSGTYTLSGDRTTTGTNIIVNAHHVTLNLNGFTLRCDPANPATATPYGVLATSRTNVRILNGAITGCWFGVHGAYSDGLHIESVDFTGNTYIGVNAGYGTNAVIRASRFEAIAGYQPEAYAIGVNALGSGSRVEGNVCRNLYRQPGGTGTGEGVCILVASGATDVTIRHNLLRNDTAEAETIGVWVASGSSAMLADNTIEHFERAILGSGRVSVSQSTLSVDPSLPNTYGLWAIGSAWDNVLSGFATSLGPDIIDEGNVID